MITLKDYLTRKFNSSILIITSISWILIFLSLIGWGFFSASKSLKLELEESASTVTSLIYDKNWSLINEHFNSKGRVEFFSYVNAKSKQDNSVLYEARFKGGWEIPEICESNNSSELVVLKACTRLIRSEVLLFVSMSMFLYLLALLVLFKLIQLRILSSFDSLSTEIGNSLDEEPLVIQNNSLKIEEIENIKTMVEAKKRELKKTSQEAAFIKLSQKVTHDLRSPLAVIANISNKNEWDSHDKDILKSSALMLHDISSYLLDTSLKNTSKLPRLSRLNIVNGIKAIINLKEEEYPKYKDTICFKSEVSSTTWAWLNHTEFSRVLSNIINNSFESSQTPKIDVELTLGDVLILSIKDNGPGFSKEVLESFHSSRPKSTKSSGHGIGLISAKASILSMGGELTISNRSGACVDICFPRNVIFIEKAPIALIDDDKYIRHSWIGLAEKYSFEIKAFSDFNGFLSEQDKLDRNTEVFVDSNLGNNIRGEDIISDIKNLGFRIVNIQTGYNESEVKFVEGLNNIVTKEFPYTTKI